MNGKMKKELNKFLLSAAIGFGGLIFSFLVVVPVAQKLISNQMYKIAAGQMFKPLKECNIYKDRYINEMAKQKEGHPEVIAEEAKINKCRK